MFLLPLGFIGEASFKIVSPTDLIRVNGPQLLAHGMLQREGRNLRTNQNLRALSHAERIGHVDGWSRGTSESIIAGVPDDAHNLEPGSSDIWRRQHRGGIAFETCRSQRVPNGIAIRKVALRQRTVDHGYVCALIILGVAPNPSLQQRNAQSHEVFRADQVHLSDLSTTLIRKLPCTRMHGFANNFKS